ncbi:hypothetical protein RFI_00748, partial [Reticulomyxa filosa]
MKDQQGDPTKEELQEKQEDQFGDVVLRRREAYMYKKEIEMLLNLPEHILAMLAINCGKKYVGDKMRDETMGVGTALKTLVKLLDKDKEKKNEEKNSTKVSEQMLAKKEVPKLHVMSLGSEEKRSISMGALSRLMSAQRLYGSKMKRSGQRGVQSTIVCKLFAQTWVTDEQRHELVQSMLRRCEQDCFAMMMEWLHVLAVCNDNGKQTYEKNVTTIIGTL